MVGPMRMVACSGGFLSSLCCVHAGVAVVQSFLSASSSSIGWNLQGRPLLGSRLLLPILDKDSWSGVWLLPILWCLMAIQAKSGNYRRFS
jgi:hypothetical protein